jgi:hypothetical protein
MNAAAEVASQVFSGPVNPGDYRTSLANNLVGHPTSGAAIVESVGDHG